MAKASRLMCVFALMGMSLAVSGCGETASAAANVEKLPDVTPSVPPVPTLPPPPHPIQYDDQSYSVYGLRRAIRRTIDTDVAVTAYIADVYQPPECPKREKCPLPPAPHLYLADTREETEKGKMLLLAGYAENQAQLDEALKDAMRGKVQEVPEDSGMLVTPTDFYKGAKIKVQGKFAYMSGSGFQSSEGVLEYGGHETLEKSPEDPVANRPAGRRRR